MGGHRRSARILMFLLKKQLIFKHVWENKFQIEDSVETDTGYFEMQQLILSAGLIKDETLWECSDIVTHEPAAETLV